MVVLGAELERTQLGLELKDRTQQLLQVGVFSAVGVIVSNNIFPRLSNKYGRTRKFMKSARAQTAERHSCFVNALLTLEPRGLPR